MTWAIPPFACRSLGDRPRKRMRESLQRFECIMTEGNSIMSGTWRYCTWSSFCVLGRSLSCRRETAQQAKPVLSKPAVFPNLPSSIPSPRVCHKMTMPWPLLILPDGTLLTSAGADSITRLWDPRLPSCCTNLPVIKTRSRLWHSRDGERLATAPYDKSLKIWDVAARKEIVTLSGHTNAVLAVAFLPDVTEWLRGKT